MAYTYLWVAYASLEIELFWDFWSGFGPTGLNKKKKNYLLGLTHDVNHFNRDWVSSSLEPGIQVIGDKKCGVYKCEV